MSEIKQINTGVAEIIAVKVPEGITGWAIGNGCVYFNSVGVKLIPYGDYEPLGIDTELTEEQCRGVVKYGNDYFEPGYLNYMLPIGSVNRFRYNTAKEAFASLMQANGFYSKNPYGTNPIKRSHYSDGELHIADILIEKWQQAEANTGTWLVLKRLS